MNQPELATLLEKAEKATEERNYQQALNRYDELLALTDAPLEDPALKELRLTALRDRSRLQAMRGKRDNALAGFEQYYLEAGSSQHAARALALIGDLHADVGRHQEALEAYREGLHLAQAFNDTQGRATALMGIGLTLHRLGRSDDALSNLRKALALLEQTHDVPGQGRAWSRLGIVHVQMGQIDRALDAFEESLIFSRQTGDRETAITLSNLGECHQLLFNMEEALDYHRQALSLAESTQLGAVEADIARNLGFDLVSLGEVEEGIAILLRALKVSEEAQDRDVRLQALNSLALAELQRANGEQARYYAEKLKRSAEARNYRVYQAEALYVLGQVDELQGDQAAAEQRWQEAVFLAHETGRQFLLWQIHAALARIADNPGLAQVHYRIAADIIDQIVYPIEAEDVRNAFLNSPPVRVVLDRAP